jgi:hypothetical protein
MYQDFNSGENVYSIAEASFLLGIVPAEVLKLIKSNKLGAKFTEYGFVVTNGDIAQYLAYGKTKPKKKRHRNKKSKAKQ